jgi:hypothetical protein
MAYNSKPLKDDFVKNLRRLQGGSRAISVGGECRREAGHTLNVGFGDFE